MSRLQSALFVLMLLALPAILPAAHPEARLFSDGWGSGSFIDPNFCMTQIEGQPPRMALFPKMPAVAHLPDRLTLAAQYLVWGLLLPVAALLATLHFAARHPALLSFGLLGLVPAWFQWSLNPAFVSLRQGLAELWLAHWPLQESQFVWLDGIALLAWLAGGTLLAGGASFIATSIAARLAGIDRRQLTKALVPLAAVTVFLGLTQTTALYLRGEGVSLDWLPYLRAVLLILAIGMSAWLAMRPLQKVGVPRGFPAVTGKAAHKTVAGLLWLVPSALTALHGWAMYFHWTDRYHV